LKRIILSLAVVAFLTPAASAQLTINTDFAQAVAVNNQAVGAYTDAKRQLEMSVRQYERIRKKRNQIVNMTQADKDAYDAAFTKASAYLVDCAADLGASRRHMNRSGQLIQLGQYTDAHVEARKSMNWSASSGINKTAGDSYLSKMLDAVIGY
jgi:hypothetical protein